jgi:NAD(P)H-dependent FMN reductase
MKLIAFAGALRAESLNRRLLRLAVRGLEREGAEVDVVDLRALAIPFYDGDLEASAGLPPGALELATRISEAGGLVIAAPEYNFGVPALVKNTIDWMSRARPMPLRGKTALLLSASPSLVGGSRGLLALRPSLEVLGVHVYPDMFSLASADKALDADGAIADPALARFLDRMIAGFARTTRALSAGR